MGHNASKQRKTPEDDAIAGVDVTTSSMTRSTQKLLKTRGGSSSDTNNEEDNNEEDEDEEEGDSEVPETESDIRDMEIACFKKSAMNHRRTRQRSRAEKPTSLSTTAAADKKKRKRSSSSVVGDDLRGNRKQDEQSVTRSGRTYASPTSTKKTTKDNKNNKIFVVQARSLHDSNKLAREMNRIDATRVATQLTFEIDAPSYPRTRSAQHA